MAFVEHPGLHCLLVLVIMLMFLTFHRACAVRMVVGIAVNLDVVGPQLLIVGQNIVHGNYFSALVLLAVHRVRGYSLTRYFRIGHVLGVLVGATRHRSNYCNTRESTQDAHIFLCIHILNIKFDCLFL